MFPCKDTGDRDKPVDQNVLALLSSFPLNNESANLQKTTNKGKHTRYQVTSEERRSLRRTSGSLSGA